MGEEVGASYVVATLGFGAKGSSKPCWVRTWSDLSFQTIILALVSAPALVNFPLVNTHLLTSKRFRQCLVGRGIVKFITCLVRPLENCLAKLIPVTLSSKTENNPRSGLWSMSRKHR